MQSLKSTKALTGVLESLHRRLLSLEISQTHNRTLDSVWDIKFELTLEMNPFELVLHAGLPAPHPENLLFPTIPSQGLKGKISFLDSKRKVNKITLQEEILARLISNGKDLPMVVCLAQLDSNPTHIVIKFRRCEIFTPGYILDEKQKEIEEATEKEGRNMINTFEDPAIKDLFPKIECIGDVDISPKYKWEFIGSQELLEIKDTEWDSDWSLPECFSLVKKLHDAGYSHGDCHLGNFMKVQQSDPNKQTTNGLIMIDQDEIMNISALDKDIKNFRIIMDYNMLFIWNRFCNFFTEKYKQKYDMNAVCYRLFKVYRGTPKMMPVITPWAFYHKFDGRVESYRTYIDYYPEYKLYLESLSVDEIDDFYSELSNDKKKLQQLNQNLEKAYIYFRLP